MEETLLTVEEVVAYLRVNARTVYRLVKAGEIPAVRVGKLWRFRRSSLDAWLEKHGTPARDDRRGADPGPSPAMPARHDRSRWVLVVDDEQQVREVLAKILARATYKVDAVPDGDTAIQRLRAETYDLLITDLKMPGMDGIDLIRAARRISPALPVVIITGHGSEGSAIDAVNLGVTGYLTKPFQMAQVLAIAKKALGE